MTQRGISLCNDMDRKKVEHPAVCDGVFVLPEASGKTVMEALEEQGAFMDGGCGGKMRCGRCKVRYASAAPEPVDGERRFLTEEQLGEGIRLSCFHKVEKECHVQVLYEKTQMDILSETARRAAASGIAAGSPWCIAIDLGTTTIAAQARRMSDGKVLAVWKAMNPQRRFGSDVISRMQAAQDGKAGSVQRCLQEVLARGVRELTESVRRAAGDVAPEGSMGTAPGCRAAGEGRSALAIGGSGHAAGHPAGSGDEGIKNRLACGGSGNTAAYPAGIFLAGNTAMEHLLAGLSVDSLCRFPFEPVTLDEQTILIEETNMTLLPGLSAFVGADILAGVLSVGMHRQEKISLLIDLGTNGEIVLGNREKLLCTATAAGPAFEGGPGTQAPGTDMIAVIAQLLDAGIVDETGLLEEPWFETGIRWKLAPDGGHELAEGNGGRAEAGGVRTAQPPAGKTVFITQPEIRAVQMAKAAIYAGVCVLLKEYGIGLEDVDEVWLAGGFGYYLDTKAAAKIGLFPKELAKKAKAAGNTSLDGAFFYARGGRRESEEIRRITTAVNLAQHPAFEELYLEHMGLEEA